MQLSDRQRQQVDAIASLVTQADRASIRQGVELAAALGDQSVFAALLEGVKAPPPVPTKRPPQKRYPTLERGVLFDEVDGRQAWLDLAVTHLVAASELPIRTEVTSLALGDPRRRGSKSAPPLWMDGLERLTSLTHLDLHFSTADTHLDLGILQRFPRLTHLRLRGSDPPGHLPALKHLEVLDGPQITFDSDAVFPALRSIRGRPVLNEPLRPSRMPSLVDVQARGDVRMEGFQSLRKLACHQGDFELRGCSRIERLWIVNASLNAPDLLHIGTMVGAGPGIDVSQLETLGAVKFNRTSRFSGGVFPKGTKLADPKIIFWGPALTDLGNVGELSGLEILVMTRVEASVSLETLRHATSLRVLDIRNSPGITDLSPLVGLPNLEVIVLRSSDPVDIPDELVDLVRENWRPPPSDTTKGRASGKG